MPLQPVDLPDRLHHRHRGGRRPDGEVHPQGAALDLRDDLPAGDLHREQGRHRRVVPEVPRGHQAAHRCRGQDVARQGRCRDEDPDGPGRHGRQGDGQLGCADPADGALLTSAGQTLPDKATFVDADGKPRIRPPTAPSSRSASRPSTRRSSPITIDALAAAYKYLDFQKNPVGSGPFKFVNYKSGESLEYAANPDYHFGAPKISKLFIPIIKDDLAGGQALVAGQVDWKYSLEGATYNQIKDNPNLKFVEYPDFGFFGVYFNQHPDAHALFADKNLRQAVAYCFDKVETVKAATEDQGVAIYCDIPPASWAYPATGLNTYPMDPAKGKQLIESSGWTMGSDGIYEKDGKKLATVVAVRAGRPNRSEVDAAPGRPGEDELRDGHQVQGSRLRRDPERCSTTTRTSTRRLLNRRSRSTRTSAGSAPASTRIRTASITARQCSTAKNPETFNYECYQNPEVDKLIEQGLREFDQAKRAAIYQEYAKLQAEDLPVIYAWSDIAREGLRKTVNSTGELPMDTPTWFWEVEKLTNQKS